MKNGVIELCSLNMKLYNCISKDICTERVVLTDKQILHMVDSHPDAYNDVLLGLTDTITDPDYIIRDDKHADTGLVIRKITSHVDRKENLFLVLRICTDSHNGELANSVISGWKISDKRMHSYLRNKTVLYIKE